MTPQESYEALVETYDAIQEYLDDTVLGPEHDQLLEYHNQLGEKIYIFNTAIIEETSAVLNANSDNLNVIVKAAKEAKGAINDINDHLKKVVKITRGLDRTLTQLQKIV